MPVPRTESAALPLKADVAEIPPVVFYVPMASNVAEMAFTTVASRSARRGGIILDYVRILLSMLTHLRHCSLGIAVIL